jgi:transposase-like protein
MIPRNNPTASPRLQSNFSDSRVSPIKSKYNGLGDLNILCASCTVFDDNKKTVKRVELWHDKRNERFVCQTCNKTYSERQIRYALKLDLPEYIYYDEGSSKDVSEIDKEREKTEKWMIKPINSESPDSKSSKKVARVIK